MTQVAIVLMACDCERETWNNKMQAVNLVDLESNLNEGECEERKGQMHLFGAMVPVHVGPAFCGILSKHILRK